MLVVRGTSARAPRVSLAPTPPPCCSAGALIKVCRTLHAPSSKAMQSAANAPLLPESHITYGTRLARPTYPYRGRANPHVQRPSHDSLAPCPLLHPDYPYTHTHVLILPYLAHIAPCLTLPHVRLLRRHAFRQFAAIVSIPPCTLRSPALACMHSFVWLLLLC